MWFVAKAVGGRSQWLVDIFARGIEGSEAMVVQWCEHCDDVKNEARSVRCVVRINART